MILADSDKQREDEWAKHKWECLVRYVASLNRADQIAWSKKQSEITLEKMRDAIRKSTANSDTERP